MEEDPILEELHAFIARQFLANDTSDFTSGTPLLDWGIVDSFGVAQLVAFVSERLGVEIPSDEITPTNFETLQALSVLVHRLQDGSRE